MRAEARTGTAADLPREKKDIININNDHTVDFTVTSIDFECARMALRGPESPVRLKFSRRSLP